ncbi:MAG: hypothetical protein JSW73_01660 [Candidatus Woesearchaeota archaeon]|nr:MAG: hypothetical protein JSW73_01660 [Candidatus Woesearchaeota archaeon]
MVETESSQVLNANQIEKKQYFVLNPTQIGKMSNKISGLENIVYDDDGSYEQNLEQNEQYIGKLRATRDDAYADISVTFGDNINPNFFVFANTDLGLGGLCALLRIREHVNDIISNGADTYKIEKMGKRLTNKRKLKYNENGVFTGDVVCDDSVVGKATITKKRDYAEINFELSNEYGIGWITTITTDLKLGSNNLKVLQKMREQVELNKYFKKALNKYEKLIEDISDQTIGMGFIG